MSRRRRSRLVRSSFRKAAKTDKVFLYNVSYKGRFPRMCAEISFLSRRQKPPCIAGGFFKTQKDSRRWSSARVPYISVGQSSASTSGGNNDILSVSAGNPPLLQAVGITISCLSQRAGLRFYKRGTDHAQSETIILEPDTSWIRFFFSRILVILCVVLFTRSMERSWFSVSMMLPMYLYMFAVT